MNEWLRIMMEEIRRKREERKEERTERRRRTEEAQPGPRPGNRAAGDDRSTGS